MQDTKIALEAESWTLYALGVALILSRTACRLVTLGSLARLQLDDWIMLLVLIPFTGMIFCVNETYASNGMTVLESDVVWRRKMRFILEELRVTVNWSVKACLLILYRRIFPASTSNRERQYVTWLSVSCALSYIATQISLPLWCYPTNNYWSTSPPDVQCTTYRDHAILTLILSTATTFATMMLPVPLIPTPRKPLLAILLLVGTFTMISGILSRYFTLVSPTSSTPLHWFVAESVAMILFANLPFLSSLYTLLTTTPSRLRKLSSTVSLSQWPRPYKDKPSLPTHRERLNSTATTIITFSPERSHRLGSPFSAPPRIDIRDGWHDADTPCAALPPLVRQMTLTDPPPELEVYWSTRRPSTKGTDVESLGVREIQWPLR